MTYTVEGTKDPAADPRYADGLYRVLKTGFKSKAAAEKWASAQRWPVMHTVIRKAWAHDQEGLAR